MRSTSLPVTRSLTLLGAAALLLTGAPAADAQLRSPPPVRSVSLKDPTVARLLAIVPGGGHLYAGESSRAGLVLGTVVGIMLVGGTMSDNAVECPGEEYSSEYCTSPTLDAITYTLAAGALGWSIVDAGRAAHRTNARRLRRASLVIQGRPAQARGGYRLGVNIPFGGS